MSSCVAIMHGKLGRPSVLVQQPTRRFLRDRISLISFPTNTGMPPCSIARIDTVKPVRSSHVVIPRQPVIHPLRARDSRPDKRLLLLPLFVERTPLTLWAVL